MDTGLNPLDLRLGKLPHRHDPRTLQLARYVAPEALPPRPPAVDYTGFVQSWPVFANDRVGDCTCAAAGHMEELWGALAKRPQEVAEADVLAMYEAASGYDPATGANDNGAVELEVLKLWRSRGLAGRRIGAFASVDVGTEELIKDAVWLLGGVYIGVALPSGAQDQMAQRTWSLPTTGRAGGRWTPGSWGGHAVNVTGFDAYGVRLVTWGQVFRMTWGFWRAYCDEAWAIVSPDMLDGSGLSPQGLDVQALNQDLARLGRVA